jgi:hypothetical protein
MKTSDIYVIITEKNINKISTILSKYDNEYEEYKKIISKKGVSIHFKTDIDNDFIFIKNHLLNLAELFIKDIINELQLNFIVDNIFASINTFESDEIMEELEYLTDPEVNGHTTKEYLISLVNRI